MPKLKLLQIENNNSRETIKNYLLKKFKLDYLKYNHKIPYLTNEWNISISNKNNLILLGFIKKPLKIGVDLEDLNQDINIKTFKKGILNKNEAYILNKSNLDEKQTLILIWSIKESFFKYINVDFDPKKVLIEKFEKNKFEIKFGKYQGTGKYLIKKELIYTYCHS